MTISYQQYITSRFQVKLIQDVDFKHVGTLSMEQPAVILRCNFFFQQWNLYFVSCVLCNTPQNHYFVWGLSDNHVNCRLTELALSFAFSVGASSRRWICQLYWGYYFLSFHPAFIFFCFFFFFPLYASSSKISALWFVLWQVPNNQIILSLQMMLIHTLLLKSSL